MLKIGIVGLGHLGEIHLQNWLKIVSQNAICVFDIRDERVLEILSQYPVQRLHSFQEIIDQVDIIDIVTPTDMHFELAELGLKAKKHLFIEKPVCETLEQAERLAELQKISNTLVQIGHVERYNPAYTSIEPYILKPKFFEIHRLAPFNPRGTEVSVVMDLMIHDLDIVMSLVQSPLKHISANGVNIVSKTPDIVNARLEFENGCVVNLTASRISMKKMRKMRIFSDEGYISIDFLEKKSEFIKISSQNVENEGLRFINSEGEEKILVHKEYKKIDGNAIFDELNDFYNRLINNKKTTKVNLENSILALDTAIKIQNECNKN